MGSMKVTYIPAAYRGSMKPTDIPEAYTIKLILGYHPNGLQSKLKTGSTLKLREVWRGGAMEVHCTSMTIDQQVHQYDL